MSHRRPFCRPLLLGALACLLLVGAPARAAQECPPAVAPATDAQLEAAAREDRGFLWAIERDGHTSYLYGTLHVGRPEWLRLGPRVAAAYAASEVLALEIDPTDAGVKSDLAAVGGDTAAAPLPAPLKARLARQVAAACLPESAFAAIAPAMQAVLLGVLEARWAGLDPAYAQEQGLARRARDDGRRIVSLESVALQSKVLVPTAPKEAQSMIEGVLDELESGTGRRVIVQLAAAWEHSDYATLDDYERWCECARNDDERAAMRALNDDRNPALAERIDALHRDGRVFAAVGALHMVGARALPRLLAARGFRIERIALSH